VCVPAFRIELSGARLVFCIDVNFGDPITPAPVILAYPSLLTEPFDIVGYPLPAVLAEKLVTMLQLADANTRDRDIGDVVLISRTHRIDAAELRAACQAVAGHRGVALARLATVLGDLAARRQLPWTRWLARTGLASLPADVSAALDEVIGLAESVLTGEVTAGMWQPQHRTWAHRSPSAAKGSKGTDGGR
jgi:hypothetical protein